MFTDGETVLNALKKVFHEAQPVVRGPSGEPINGERLNIPGNDGHLTPRRTSGASSVSGKVSITIPI